MPRNPEDFATLQDEIHDLVEEKDTEQTAVADQADDRRLFAGQLEHRQENLDHLVDDRKQAQFPGADPVSHDTAAMAGYKETLEIIDPRAALAFSQGANMAQFSPEHRAEYAVAHIQSFENTDFATDAEKMEAAQAIAGRIFDPMHHQLRQDLAALTGDDALRQETALAGLEIYQLAFARELFQADFDPLHENNAAYILNNAASWMETAGEKAVDFHALQELASAIDKTEDDKRAVLESLVETLIQETWKGTNLAIDALAATDPAAAAVQYALSSREIRDLSGQLAEGLINGLSEVEFNLHLAVAKNAAEEHGKTLEFHPEQNNDAFKGMTYEELRQHAVGMEHAINDMTNPKLQMEARQLYNEGRPYLEILNNAAEHPTRDNAADDPAAHFGIQVGSFLDHWRPDFEKMMETLQAYLNKDELTGAPAAA